MVSFEELLREYRQRGKLSQERLGQLLKVLHEHGGIIDLEKANDLLLAGNFRPLDEDETRKIFPRVQAEEPKSPQRQTPVNPENKNSIENWPPYIPVEPYYPLPDCEEILINKNYSPKGKLFSFRVRRWIMKVFWMDWSDSFRNGNCLPWVPRRRKFFSAKCFWRFII